MHRLRVPPSAPGLIATPAVEGQLTDRQREMVKFLVAGQEFTSRACEPRFKVTRPVIADDFRRLMEIEIAERIGKGRSARYRLRSRKES